MALISKILNKIKEKFYIKNSTIIDSDPEKMYNTMYPIIDIDYLDKFINNQDEKKELLDLFEVETIINKCDKPNCISVSFFCQNVNNTFVNEFGTINYNDVKTAWYKKYVVNLMKFINDFNKSKYNKTYKLRIYLEKQLSEFIPKLQQPNVEIYHMKNNSIGGCPGLMWRYLALDDKDIEIVHVFDIDENFNMLTSYIDLFSKSNKTLGRVFMSSSQSYLVDKQKIAVNYPVVMGGMIGFRPKQNDISFCNTCVNYMLYKMLRSKSIKPNLENDTDPETIYNIPINNHIYGWGSHWYMYAFDERIWKHLFFPHFVKKGEVLSYSRNNLNNIKLLCDVHPCKIDYKFCKLYDNEFV